MLDSDFGFIGFIALVVLIVVVFRQGKRLKLIERELGVLRTIVASRAAGVSPEQPAESTAEAAAMETAQAGDVPDNADADVQSRPVRASVPKIRQQPTTGDDDEPRDAAPAAARPARPDMETALGTRWAVWVGGLALALGGLFLVRYSIESGFFGPGARLVLASVFGIVLLCAGEFIRRRGSPVQLAGAAGDYIPAILTAAGSFTLFGAVYAAHAVYGFIGPAPGFLLLGLIALGTIGLALIHGQALAGIGLLGALATPLLVASEAPNAWALFGYLAIVLAAATAVARIRMWRFLASAAHAGTGLWSLAYLAESGVVDVWAALFINGVSLASLAAIWCRRQAGGGRKAAGWRAALFPSAIPAFFVALVAIVLLVEPELQAAGGSIFGTVLLAAMLAAAAWRREALALIYGAGIGAALVFLRLALTGSFSFVVLGETLTFDGLPVDPLAPSLAYPGLALALLFLGVGFWKARATVGADGRAAASWAAFGGFVSFIILLSCWFSTGDIDRDLAMAGMALALAVALAAGSEAVSRSEAPPMSGGAAVSFGLAASFAAAVMMIHMAFGSLLTTVLAGVLAAVPALSTRLRRYPVLGWLCVAGALVVLARVALDPTLVGPSALSTTPVFNALLPGYGLPTLAFVLAAWQLARTTGGRPRLVMEAVAALFGALTLAMLVRHAMNGGVIDATAPTLAEQAIYSLIALGAGAVLVALDMRQPSSVFRYGSMAIGVVSVGAIVIQHFVLLNPLLTDESTGRIPVVNLLFLAYLLPAGAAAALAFYARDKRPRWYLAMLGLTAAALAFAYATLSVRRLFKGEFIGLWRGLAQVETYSYSALWLGLGVALLVVGVRMNSTILRLASGGLIAIAVAKVFLFDMSALEGVLRALSFIGLGAVLIGIGLFYQRLLSRAAKT